MARFRRQYGLGRSSAGTVGGFTAAQIESAASDPGPQGHNAVYAGPANPISDPAAPTWRDLVVADIPTLPATKIGGGSVSNTEFGYLDGVTSAIQTQFSDTRSYARRMSVAMG